MAEKSIPHYPRPEYAKEIANGLLGTPSEGGGFNHGLFISGHRRTGKTFFLKLDLMPELHSRGAITVYVDLSSDGNDGRPTKEVIREALLQKKNELDREKKERMSAQLGH
ncbi:hypothetical protein RZS08_10275, partial [Arthrospira platensis SPKY1]|nr:hypothetical protein [Arthrospira platensis SPKY1]